MASSQFPGKASIIILTHNNLEYTSQCLESIFEKTSFHDYELVIVDNASTDGTPEFLEEVKSQRTNVKTQINKQNVGFAR
jgi:GT2 family glycosyltransferase